MSQHHARAASLAVLCAAGISIFTGVHAGASDDREEGRDHGYTIALFGDMPYNTPGRAQYPALLADINASRVAFSVFDGDVRSARFQ